MARDSSSIRRRDIGGYYRPAALRWLTCGYPASGAGSRAAHFTLNRLNDFAGWSSRPLFSRPAPADTRTSTAFAGTRHQSPCSSHAGVEDPAFMGKLVQQLANSLFVRRFAVHQRRCVQRDLLGRAVRAVLPAADCAASDCSGFKPTSAPAWEGRRGVRDRSELSPRDAAGI